MKKVKLNLQTSLYLNDDGPENLTNPVIAAYNEATNTVSANINYKNHGVDDVLKLHPDCNVFWTDSYDISFWSHGQCEHIHFSDIQVGKVTVWWNSSQEEKDLDPGDFEEFKEGVFTHRAEFDTEAEAKAFCTGLQDGAGWMGEPSWKQVKTYK